MQIDLPVDMMTDRVNVLARDGVVRDGDLRPTGEREVAKFVPCLIVADGRNRLPAELMALAAQDSAQVLMGPTTPHIREGFVLEEVTTRTRYSVTSARPFPSRHSVAYQVLGIVEDVVGQVPKR